MMSAGLVLIAYNLFYVLCTILLCIGICIDCCFLIIKIVSKQLITFFISLLLSAPPHFLTFPFVRSVTDSAATLKPINPVHDAIPGLVCHKPHNTQTS